jgi:hypothetical protein
MRFIALFSAALCALAALPAQAAEENRCGWFSNPTPGNAWLTDRDGEWTIGIQGSEPAEGDWPTFGKGQWVVTNGSSYGYGCACMRVTVDKQEKRVLAIKSARALPLATCRKDKTIGKAPE